MTGSECNTSPMVSFTGIMALCIAIMVMALQSLNVNHFYDASDPSNNHTIQSPNELVGDSGDDTTSQAKSNGAMCFTGAMSAACLVFCTGLIRSVYAIGSR